MNDIAKWIQDNQNTLESALRKVKGSGLKAVLLGAIEVEQVLEKEAALLDESVGEKSAALTPDKMLVSHLSEQIGTSLPELSRKLNDSESMQRRVLLQKLVAAQDQLLFRLREFL